MKNELKINAEVLGIIESYISRLDSLMEYLKSVEKILKDKRKSLFFKNATFRNFTNMNLVAHLLESKARNYGEVYELATHKNEEISYDQLIKILGVLKDTENEDVEKEKQEERQKKLERVFKDLRNVLQDFSLRIDDNLKILVIFKKGDVRNSIINNINNIKKVDENLNQLYSSSLIRLANSFELLISKMYLANLNYNESSNDSNISDRPIKFSVLSQIGGIEEAREMILEEFVNDLMKKSANDWFKNLGAINKKIFNLDDEKAEVVEFFQRRNIVIHNGGVINTYYLNNVSAKYKEGLVKGEKIEVTNNYLINKISNFRIIGLKLYWYVYETCFHGEITDINEKYQGFAFDLLNAKEYDSAEKIYLLILEREKDLNTSDQFMIKINLCQTYKWRGDQEYVEKHIENMDFSSTNDIFLMCKALLLDDFDSALNHLKHNLAAKTDKNKRELIDIYLTWPLFQKFNLENDFNKYLKELGYGINVKELSSEE
ncbi:hypothetical protein [Leuconostoc fallax]|uniref:hypothetical protein n=1 Tax=Leuconostoc fallax TaxID=1251 RepID=UPI001C1F065A|nr:hypothetical protein [Leuconostoc fallax]MBU7455354.1 hypothetical protein [Leuconostoc fallax]